MSNLVTQLLQGNKNALARLISLVEQDSPIVPEIMEAISQNPRRAYRIGITGVGGAGKSTLIDKLIHVIRRKGLTVGIVAIDPSSVLTGGAILGDRIRMQDHYLDQGVFIRSMATRGCYGGLCQAAFNTVKLVEASGKDIVLIETTGVGQTETEIIKLADLVVMVLVPGYGDSIQLMKAGLIEISDIIVINKADRDDTDIFRMHVEDEIMYSARGEMPALLLTQAHKGIGIEELYQEIEKRVKGKRKSF